jgi:broad specificity phosphatase PhoE
LCAEKPKKSMPVLYYVRHGETDLNSQGRLQGRRDTMLNAHGRQQAAECGVLLKNLFARDRRQPQELEYVSSPLKRARQTMEVLRATLVLSRSDTKPTTDWSRLPMASGKV